jgi:8-amino-3,8-dideoxy-alpha-D-manno-octulosonate transaminase
MRGAPAQMDALLDVARRKGVPIVEDVAQAGGGSFQGKRLGSLGTLGCFSFDYYKVHASGEGGFVTTSDDWLFTRAQSWHDTAACWRPDRYGHERQAGELFCGENYRMSELQGAVALAQIRKTDVMLAGYRHAHRRIKEAIQRVPGLSFRRVPDESGDTCICLIMFLKDAETTQKVMHAMQAEGVPAGGIYDKKVRDWHIYSYWDHIMQKKHVASDGLPWSGLKDDEQPHYAKEMCPKTLDFLSRAIMIDINWQYSDEDCDNIAAGINKALLA